MANSDLYGNNWTIPNNVVSQFLNNELKRNDKNQLKGYKRAQNISRSDRTMTYSMLKRIKELF